MLYQGPEGSSTHGKPVSLWRQVNVPAIYTEANHEQAFWSNWSSTQCWLKSFPHAEDALSRTRMFINTWKTGVAMKANQCSSHLHGVKPWIETFWFNNSDTQYWLTRPKHYYTSGRCSTKDQKASQHLENPFCHEGKSMFWPFIVNQTVDTDFLPARRYASAGNSDRNVSAVSVCLSVCHAPVLCQNEES